MNTCVSTPRVVDFLVECWKDGGVGAGPWTLTQPTIAQYTEGTGLTLTMPSAGSYRIIIIG